MKSLLLTKKTSLFLPHALHLSWEGWKPAPLRTRSWRRRWSCCRSRTCEFFLLEMEGDVVETAVCLLGIVACSGLQSGEEGSVWLLVQPLH